MPEFTNNPAATLTSQQLLPATPEQVYAAFEQADVLAKWWGPDGFTNTFQQFDFVPGGDWVFVMHGPDGKDYHNENIFHEIVADRRIVIEHILQPHFLLTVTLAPEGHGTLITWEQEFESPEVAERLRGMCVPANKQVLDRLQAVLEGPSLSA